MPLQPGQTIGRQYQIVESLGQGGMAAVYKAYHQRLDRYVAIKVMHQALQEDAAFKSRFEREAQIVARLDHPNIVPIYDFDEHDLQPYLAMKYIEGHTLKAVMSDGKIPPDEAVRIMSALASALDYAHARGVLHRDIKPSNMIIDTEGTPYLTDFGLARIAQAGSSTMSADVMIGTPHYISPEQAMGDKNLTPATDIYSFGVVLYEMTVGRVPFSADTPFAIVHQHIYNPPTPPSELDPSVSPAVEAVLLKALEKDPQERFTSTTEMIKAYREALAGGAPVAPAPQKAKPVTPPQAAPVRESTPTGKTSAIGSVAAEIARSAPDAARRTTGSTPAVPSGERGRIVNVPIPSEIPPADNSIEGTVRQVGDRLREVAQAIQAQVSSESGVKKIADELKRVGVEVAHEIEKSTKEGETQHDAQRSVPVSEPRRSSRPQPTAQSAADADWGGDERAIQKRAKERVKQRRGLVGHLISYFVVIGVLTFAWEAVQPAILSEILQPPFVTLAERLGADLVQALPVPVLLAIFWGTGLINHIVSVILNTGGRVEARRRVIFTSMRRRFGELWGQTASAKDYKSVRRIIDERFKKRDGFIHHLVSYLLTILGLLVSWSSIIPVLSGSPYFAMEVGDPDALRFLTTMSPVLLVAAFWGIGVALNGASVLLSPILGGEADDRRLEHELERERRMAEEYSGVSAKRKNDAEAAEASPTELPPVRLNDEGELTESYVQDLDEVERRRRGAP